MYLVLGRLYKAPTAFLVRLSEREGRQRGTSDYLVSIGGIQARGKARCEKSKRWQPTCYVTYNLGIEFRYRCGTALLKANST